MITKTNKLIARGYVKDNVDEFKRQAATNHGNLSAGGQGIIRELLQEGNIDEEEIVRIVVDLFIAAADTVFTKNPNQTKHYRKSSVLSTIGFVNT